jgi:hypothetical protein
MAAHVEHVQAITAVGTAASSIPPPSFDELVSGGERCVPGLIRVLEIGDTWQVRLASAFALEDISNAGIHDWSKGDVEPAEVAAWRAWWSAHEGQERWQWLVRDLESPSLRVRGGALSRLTNAGEKRAIPAIWALLPPPSEPDGHPGERYQIISSLARLGDVNAIPLVAECIVPLPEPVAILGVRYLEDLTGESFGGKTARSDAERRAAIGRALAWWRENGGAAGMPAPRCQ